MLNDRRSAMPLGADKAGDPLAGGMTAAGLSASVQRLAGSPIEHITIGVESEQLLEHR
jgi:hypothetical protein